MKSLKELNKKIKGELHLVEVENDEEEDEVTGEEDVDSDESDDNDKVTSSRVILRIDTESKLSAKINNLEFSIYYSDLARKLTDDDRLDYTFTKEKTRNLVEILFEEIGFYDKAEKE